MVDVSMLDCQMAFLENAFSRYSCQRGGPRADRNRHPRVDSLPGVPTGDGYLVVAAARDPSWTNFCKVIQREDLAADPRFKDILTRTKNHEAFEKEVTQALKSKTTAEWVDLMIRADIPAGRSTGWMSWPGIRTRRPGDDHRGQAFQSGQP